MLEDDIKEDVGKNRKDPVGAIGKRGEVGVERDRKHRTHGFQKPFHNLQVVTWVFFGFQQLYVLAFVSAGLSYDVSKGDLLALALTHVVLTMAVVVLAVKTTLCDTGAFTQEES